MMHSAIVPRSPEPEIEPEIGSQPSATAASLSTRFVAQLAGHSDGIGWVHVLEHWRRYGVLARLARAGAGGVPIGNLAAQTSANVGYLAVMCRMLDAFYERKAAADPSRGREIGRQERIATLLAEAIPLMRKTMPLGMFGPEWFR